MIVEKSGLKIALMQNTSKKDRRIENPTSQQQSSRTGPLALFFISSVTTNPRAFNIILLLFYTAYYYHPISSLMKPPMDPVSRRTRGANQWTEEERNRLWQLRQQHLDLGWKDFNSVRASVLLL